MTDTVVQPIAGEVTDQSECNCKEEWPTQPCPVHSEVNSGKTSTYGAQKFVVTDTLLITKDGPKGLGGYRYLCPSCTKDSILNYFNYCPNCGAMVEVRSEVAREAIRKMNKPLG